MTKEEIFKEEMQKMHEETVTKAKELKVSPSEKFEELWIVINSDDPFNQLLLKTIYSSMERYQNETESDSQN